MTIDAFLRSHKEEVYVSRSCLGGRDVNGRARQIGGRRAGEDVLVTMATRLSGKRSRCAADTSFLRTHESSLRLPERLVPISPLSFPLLLRPRSSSASKSLFLFTGSLPHHLSSLLLPLLHFAKRLQLNHVSGFEFVQQIPSLFF